MRLPPWLVLGACLTACGAESPDPVDEGAPGPDTAEQIDDGKADGVGLQVRTGVTTLWVDKVLGMSGDGQEPTLTVYGRTSRNLASVHSWVPDDAFGKTTIVGPRSFELVLTGGHEINTALSDLPIFVSIETTTGTPSYYTARLRLTPRLANFSGSSKITPSTVIRPVFVRSAEDSLRYRGTVRTTAGATLLGVLTGEGADPALQPLSASEWQFDWSYPALEQAAFPSGDDLRFSADLSGAGLEKQAELEMRVISLSMTTKDASTTWPTPECEAEVLKCVQSTPGDDLGGCGSYREVARCMNAVVPDATTFAADLKSHLVGWYAAHGADVAAMGNTLAQAQSAISVSSVSEVADPEDDPAGHDLTTTLVFSHPDVVFPGSDSVWFGAYDAASGELLEVYDFN